jgi:hypothetical protein
MDSKVVQDTSLSEIATELQERAPITFRLFCTLLNKPKFNEEALLHQVGLVTSHIFNLANQQLNIYAAKMGVMLKASGESKALHNSSPPKISLSCINVLYGAARTPYADWNNDRGGQRLTINVKP